MLNKFNNRINKCNWSNVLFVHVRKGKTGTNRVSGCQVGSLLGQRPLLAFKRNESCRDKVWIMIFLFKESEQFRTRRVISLMSLLVLRLALYFFFIHSFFFFFVRHVNHHQTTERERHFCMCHYVRFYMGDWSKPSPQQFTRRTRAHRASNIHRVVWKIRLSKTPRWGFQLLNSFPERVALNFTVPVYRQWFCLFCFVLFCHSIRAALC